MRAPAASDVARPDTHDTSLLPAPARANASFGGSTIPTARRHEKVMGFRPSISPNPVSPAPVRHRPTAAWFATRLAGRLADECGVALVIAIGVMLVLSITVTSVISYTSAGSRSTNVSTAGQKASALAEAGMNNALSVLSSSGTDSTAMRPQPAYAGDTNATVTSYVGGGTATWGANYTAATRTWAIKSIGSVPNPTGPTASDVTRTLRGNAVIAAPPYSFVSLDSLCDKHTLTVRSSGHLTVTNAMYINACDMGHDAFDVFGTGGWIKAPSIQVVGGWETHTGNDVIVNGVTCPLVNANPPALGTPGTPTAGCPVMGQPVLADPFVNVAAPALGSPACTSTAYGTAASYTALATKPKLNAAITTTSTSFPVINPSWIANGDVIQIDTEWMVVTAGGGTSTITVTRAFNSTAAAAHTSGKEIKKVPVSTLGSAATPDQCKVSSGTITLEPGTYYGGICIGAPSGSDCTTTTCVPTSPYSAAAYSPAETVTTSFTATATSTVLSGATPIVVGDMIQIESEWLLVTGVSIGGSGKTTTSTVTFTRAQLGSTAASHAGGTAVLKGTPKAATQVTLAPGTYIMAGGGFHVCGAAALSAPNVLIYNTQDATNTAGAGAIDQVLLNTNGSVSLGPQTVGTYAGLTAFQDRTLSVTPSTTSCDTKSKDWTTADMVLASMASTGANGKLGSVSGTIYIPASRAIFSTYVGGTANLAVMSSCILIDGGDATFDFQLSGLFGVGLQLTQQWG